jgi:hypothetical protein
MREQFAVNLRESVELAKEHFSIMTSEPADRNIGSLIGIHEDLQIETESLENQEQRKSEEEKEKNIATSRSYSEVLFDALNTV